MSVLVHYRLATDRIQLITLLFSFYNRNLSFISYNNKKLFKSNAESNPSDFLIFDYIEACFHANKSRSVCYCLLYYIIFYQILSLKQFLKIFGTLWRSKFYTGPISIKHFCIRYSSNDASWPNFVKRPRPCEHCSEQHYM